LVAPCQRAPGSIEGLRFDVKRGEAETRVARDLRRPAPNARARPAV
jgi:hypothetical protein